MKSLFKPVVRNLKTNDLYFYKGENEFQNIRTGVCGKVSDTAAQKTFGINPEMSILLNENPMIAEMINRLNLTYEPQN